VLASTLTAATIQNCGKDSAGAQTNHRMDAAMVQTVRA